MIKLTLRKPKHRHDPKFPAFPWASCAPFVENSNGKLIHRPKTVVSFKIHKEPHTAIDNWCGNVHVGTNKFTFLETPPEGKLLCERCEYTAVKAGLPSADELAGRHVHTGKLIAIQTCCTDKVLP